MAESLAVTQLVSVIIRSMDRPTLTAALDSVSLQTYPHIEVIVVNAKGMRHRRLEKICGRFPLRLINDDGAPLSRSEAANTGLETANGEFLIFLDDDDLFLENHIDLLVKTLGSHHTAIAAYSQVHATDQTGRILQEFATPFDAISLQTQNFLPIHAVLFRRQAYIEGARFDVELDLCEDWDFWLQVAQHGNFVFIDEMTAIYRIDQDGGFALTGDPTQAQLAERAVCTKWQKLLTPEEFYHIVVRARVWKNLQDIQAKSDGFEFQVGDLRRMLEERRVMHEQTIIAYQQATITHQQTINELQVAHQQTINELQIAHQQTINELQIAHQQTISELQIAHQQVVELYENSRSWRLTSPLRRIVQNLRLAKRAWKAFLAINWRTKAKVIAWLGTGKTPLVRRQLALAEKITEAACNPINPLAAVPELYSERPLISSLPQPVDIIIPVYDGFKFLEPLFDSLERSNSTPFRLLICDDASPDKQVWPWLVERVKLFPNAVLLQNPHNLGFVGTVNRMFELVKHDFVLLNSDVQLPPNWLERLFAPIVADSTIASVTPFTNAGAICSFPRFFEDNPLPLNLTVDEVDDIFIRLKNVPPLEIPTGVGFCMAIRYSLAKKIGLFDPEFGKGYGEENDWCQRASLAGYRHVLAPNLFVHHQHGGSFSAADRHALNKRNEALLRTRYPGLFEKYLAFIQQDPARPLRQFLDLMVRVRQARRPAFVIIDNWIPGGAQAYSRELMARKQADSVPILHLIDDFRNGELRAEWYYGAETMVIHSADYSEWGALLQGIHIEAIFLNNIYSFKSPLNLLDFLVAIREKLDVSLVVALHDFFVLCPSLFLINIHQRYCDLPEPVTCEACFKQLHTDFPAYAVSIAEWRANWGRLLAAATEIVAFSNSTRSLIMRVYPDIGNKINVRPHSIESFNYQLITVNLTQTLHIGVVGSIAWHKGWSVVKGLCDEIERRNLPYRITVIGELIPSFTARCLSVTGRYERSMLPIWIKHSGANLFLFTSIVPETFSYVAHEIMACGVPLCCFNLGAPPESIANYAMGRILTSTEPAPLLTELEAFLEDLRQKP